MVRKVLLASPRGYCAGVERAVETVERALELYGPPIYVRKQIVHNLHVVRDLEARGAIFVEDEADVPAGQTVVFSAHGVAPSVHENSRALGHDVIDATCPLVTKVHVQAKRYAANGYTVLLIGHAGHDPALLPPRQRAAPPAGDTRRDHLDARAGARHRGRVGVARRGADGGAAGRCCDRARCNRARTDGALGRAETAPVGLLARHCENR